MHNVLSVIDTKVFKEMETDPLGIKEHSFE